MSWKIRAALALGAMVAGCVSFAAGGSATEAKSLVIADFAVKDELHEWKLSNSGDQSEIKLAPGPENTTAAQITCADDPQLQPQKVRPTRYVTFRRRFDGEAAAKTSATRMIFWHKGDSVQVVFNEKDRGNAYYQSIGESKQWRRVFVSFSDLHLGWSYGGTGKGKFDLARMESFHLAVNLRSGMSRAYAVAAFQLEWSADDLPLTECVGSKTPMRLDIYPRKLDLPINRTQPLLVVVNNGEGSGLEGVSVELSLEGAGTISTHADRPGNQPAKSLRLVTSTEGKVQVRYHPPKAAGERCTITARLAGASAVPAAQADFTTVAEFHKVHLGADGFFKRPDGKRTLLLGGQFLPGWTAIAEGRPVEASRGRKLLLAATEAEQRAYFGYYADHGLNCLRGYWPYYGKLDIGPGGATVSQSLWVDGRLNEPTVAALERALAVGGQFGIGATLTLFEPANPGWGFICPGGARPEGRSRRSCMQEALESVRQLVARLMFNPNVWAYELGNEQAGSAVEASDRFVQAIKEIDEETPVMVSHTPGLPTADPLSWMSRTGIDVYQLHLYPGTSNTSADVDAGLFQEVNDNAMLGPKPWLLGESGGYPGHPPLSPAPGPVEKCYLARDCVWFALLNRSAGAFFFCQNHEENLQIKSASKITPVVDWKALRDARAMVGVATPRDISNTGFFTTADGRGALKVMADYARWGMENGVTVDFVLDAGGYRVQRSALKPFDPPHVNSPFQIGKGYQFKYRMSEDGKLVVGYLRNVAEIRLVVPPGKSLPNGSYIRVRKPLTAELKWMLPGEKYSFTIWDLDTGDIVPKAATGRNGQWRKEPTDHDFLLVWQE